MGNYFDDVLSSTSRDPNLDQGWTEIRKLDGSKTDMELIYKALSDLYWNGVEGEIAAAIIAFAEFEEYQPTPLSCEVPDKEELKSTKLAGLLNLWNPFDLGDWPKTAGPKPNIEKICEEVEVNFTSLFQQESVSMKRARGLLQALGFMDIDFVREHRQPTLRSWGQRPQVSEKKPLLAARQCSECRHCIRSFHYYVCVEGCYDSEHQRNMMKVLPIKTNSDDQVDPSMDTILHNIVLENVTSNASEFMLCPTCVHASAHPRDHLRAVRGFTRVGDQEATDFARELDIWEDHLDGRSLLSFGSMALDLIAQEGPRLGRHGMSSSRDIFPAGNSHCAVMFGPLLIENGATRSPGGAMISLRNIPNFTTSSSKDLKEFLADPSTFKIYNDEEVVHTQLLSVSNDRKLYTRTKPVRERRLMSSQRQISGGLFTGFCDRFINQEELILKSFIAGATVWTLLKAEDRSQSEYRAFLKELAEGLTDLVMQAYQFEIDKFLFGFADRLHKRAKVQYNRLSNNCQNFCNAMIFNNDKWDIMYRFTYPQVPPNRDHESDSPWLRYMMSFAGGMLHPMKEGFFVSPLVSSVSLYNAFGQNDADLVDHITSIRLKADPDSGGLSWIGFTECHDAFLAKDNEFTCPRSEGQDRCADVSAGNRESYFKLAKALLRKPCTHADHLLDGPHDNLSVLGFHVQRLRNAYTVPTNDTYRDKFLEGNPAWIENRLELLHRILVLNGYLAQISQRFQQAASQLSFRHMEKAWKPPRTFFACAWYSNKRDGNNLAKPSWAKDIQLENGSITSLLTIPMMQTHPFMQSPDIWKSRIAALKRRLQDESKDTSGIFEIPWTNCQCDLCLQFFAQQTCHRATEAAASQQHLPSEERRYLKNHPDWVSVKQLVAAIEILGGEHWAVVRLLEQLERTPEYEGAI